MTTTDTRTIYTLAGLAGCADPGFEASPGGCFLRGVEVATLEAIRWRREKDEDATLDGFQYDGGDAEIADGAVPIATYEKWQVFTDLAAWREDLDDVGGGSGDMDQDSNTALYLIASRLVQAIIENEGGTA